MELSKDSALSIKEGVDKAPKTINTKNRRRKKTPLSIDDYISGILKGNRVILGQAITLIESKLTRHQIMAHQIIEACLPHSGHSFRLGITGSPGVGKSTFIEQYGLHELNKGKKVAILAIDPSSQLSKGSILGDKTRMEQLTKKEGVFIRPSPSGQTLGGVARTTRETIILCEAAGFNSIIIETVGVGQSEIAVHSMVDFFLLLLLPGSGDELQGIKRGIVEMADAIAVNKADGNRLELAQQAARAYKNALHLFPPKSSSWIPKVFLCSGLEGKGIDRLDDLLSKYQKLVQENDFFQQNRNAQSKYWLYETINQQLKQRFFDHPAIKDKLPQIENDILHGKLTSFNGADELLALYEAMLKK